MEQLTEEEKNTRQMTWGTYSGDSREDENFTLAPVKIPIQENKLKYMKIDEVSWAKINLWFTRRKSFYCLGYLKS